MHKTNHNTRIVVIVLLLIGTILPIFLRNNSYYMDILINVAIFIILAAALNLLLGFTGQISMGQAAFFGLGAYTATLLRMKLDIPFIPAMIGSIILCFAVGLLFGIPSTRMNAIFLSIATAGLNSIVVLLLKNLRSLTNGSSGITRIPNVLLFGEKMNKLEYYYMALIFVLLILLICYRIFYSKSGRAFMAIKGNPIAASSMGINVFRYKLLVFAVGAAFSAVAGTLYAFNIRFISPDAFTSTTSIKILSATIIGGMGDLFGPLCGAVVIGTLPEILGNYPALQITLYGAFIVLILRFMPGGIMSVIRKLIRKWQIRYHSERRQ